MRASAYAAVMAAGLAVSSVAVAGGYKPAVKVKVNVCHADAADTAVGDTLMVPLPSAASATAP